MTMDAARMKEILKKEYGICNEKEFNAAVSKIVGINLGIFTMPLAERSVAISEKTREAIA